MLSKYFVLIGLTVALSGCAEVMYDVLQDKAINNCQKLYEPERSQCVKRNKTTYQTYRKETYEKVRQPPVRAASAGDYQSQH